jgi:hypothetical protein
MSHYEGEGSVITGVNCHKRRRMEQQRNYRFHLEDLTSWICNWEICGSNCSQRTSYPDQNFHDFP